MKVLRNEKHRGYTPEADKPEGFEVPEDYVKQINLLKGPNLWPTPGLRVFSYLCNCLDDVHWDILLGWRRYHREALKVAGAIASIIAQALNLDDDFFYPSEMLGKPIATLHLLHVMKICKDNHAKPQIWEYVPSVEEHWL